MVQAAERIYQHRKPLWSGEQVRPADVEQDPALAAHFRRQDAERLPLKRQVQVHGERSSDGSPTPEMVALMACCARQVEENGRMYEERRRRALAPEGRMTQRQINAAMGASATERKPAYEDPEALRRGRIELGLEGA